MPKHKSSISKASSYQDMGAYWDEHDLSGVWEQTEPVDIAIDIQSTRKYYAIEREISDKLSEVAIKRGISPETLELYRLTCH